MDIKPKCIIVTGRQGSGKTTLAKKLGERMWMPVIIRDEIKEGYINTFGIKHDELPPDANRLVTDFFFEMVNRYLTGNASVIIEAAFQHHVWEPRMPSILKIARTWMVLCTAADNLTSRRPLDRAVANPEREFYHGDHRAANYRKTGEVLTPASYEAPKFDVPRIQVSTDEGYVPSIEEIVGRIKETDL